MHVNELTGLIIEKAIDIHRKLGPGLLESVYRKILAHELRKQGLEVIEEQPIPVVWDNERLPLGFRSDLLVSRTVVVETKSKEAISPVDKKQLLTHMRLMEKSVGLLINFHVAVLREGITRVVNGLKD